MMIDKFYIGALLDVNNQQYRPIMKTIFSKKNRFGEQQGKIYNMQSFDDNKFSYSTPSKIVIKYSDTLDTFREIQIPGFVSSTGNYPFVVDKINKKIHFINYQEGYIFNAYDYITGENVANKLTGENVNKLSTITRIFLDDEFIYLTAPDTIIKYSRTDFSEIAFATVGTTLAFDGDFFYSFYSEYQSTRYYHYFRKFDKETFTVVATSPSVVDVPSSTGTRYDGSKGYSFNNNIYLSIRQPDYTNPNYNTFIFNKETMRIIARLSNKAYDFALSEMNNKIYFAGYNGLFTENDIYTLELKNTLNTVLNSTEINFVYADDKSDTVLLTEAQALNQIERSYEIQSYKKILK